MQEIVVVVDENLLSGGKTGTVFDAKSSSGSIESDHPVTVHGLTKKHLQGEVRGGGAVLKIRTSSGSIRIK